MSTLVVRLNGGLGNQLFQFALGRTLMSMGHTVRYDLSFFEQSPGLHVQRPYELGVFNAKIERASTADIRLAKHEGSILCAALAAIHPRLAPERPVKELADFTFDPAILRIDHDAYLDGYWQTEKYFTSIADELRQVLTFRKAAEGPNAEVAQRIMRTLAVSIHVRRGDYVSHPAAKAHFVTCEPAYYSAAIERIVQRIPEAHFFLFADDIGWARENIRTGPPLEFIEHNTAASSFEDMRLMALCRHHIIANSSFSWWGAWLDQHPDKLVIAPRRWLRDGSSTNDLIPLSWTLL